MENSNIKVSIIIPVYNGAEFLRRSFDCAIYQTLNDIEVLAINDCSPNPRDSEIMREYEELYPGKFRCFWHEENTRQGGARNTGIKNARGKYFICVDQDDFFELDMCEKMYEKALADDSDIVISGFCRLDGGKIIKKLKPNERIELVANEERYKYLQINVVWILLVNTEMVKLNSLYFPTNVTCDDLISFFWYISAKKISRVDKVYYHWIDNELSASKTLNSHFLSLVPTIEQIISYPYYLDLNIKSKRRFDRVFCKFMVKIALDYQTRSNCGEGIWQEYKRLIRQLNKEHEFDYVIEIIDANIGNIYDIYMHIIAKNIEEIIFKGDHTASRNIVIWGTGVRGKRLAGYLKKLKIPFTITDNNRKLVGTTIEGVEVRPWDELRPNAEFVIASPLETFDEIKADINDPNITVIDYQELMTL